MRKLILLGSAAGLMALGAPSGAWANQVAGYTGSDCNYAKGGPVGTGPQTASVGTTDPGTGNQAYVYAGPGSTGNAGTTAAGACVNSPTVGGVTGVYGGSAEAGASLGKGQGGLPGAYGVVDGNDNNTQPQPPPGVPGAGASKGYVGASNYEDGTQDTTCNGDNGGTAGSTNSGGCVGIKNTPVIAPVPLVVCGNTSGADWNSSDRDGCFIP